MESFPWEPPDDEDGRVRRSVWVGGDGVEVGDVVVVPGVVSSSDEFGVSACRLGGGDGWEMMPGREGDGTHGAAASCCSDLEVEVGGSQEGVVVVMVVQLDLGLRDITRYSSYSKLWQTLYFVNDAPFRIRNH